MFIRSVKKKTKFCTIKTVIEQIKSEIKKRKRIKRNPNGWVHSKNQLETHRKIRLLRYDWCFVCWYREWDFQIFLRTYSSYYYYYYYYYYFFFFLLLLLLLFLLLIIVVLVLFIYLTLTEVKIYTIKNVYIAVAIPLNDKDGMLVKVNEKKLLQREKPNKWLKE